MPKTTHHTPAPSPQISHLASRYQRGLSQKRMWQSRMCLWSSGCKTMLALLLGEFLWWIGQWWWWWWWHGRWCIGRKLIQFLHQQSPLGPPLPLTTRLQQIMMIIILMIAETWIDEILIFLILAPPPPPHNKITLHGDDYDDTKARILPNIFSHAYCIHVPKYLQYRFIFPLQTIENTNLHLMIMMWWWWILWWWWWWWKWGWWRQWWWWWIVVMMTSSDLPDRLHPNQLSSGTQAWRKRPEQMERCCIP